MTRTTLMVAARAPVAGETKTRLGEAIGHDRAAHLYACFLKDLARTLQQVNQQGVDVTWAYSPPASDFSAVLRELDVDSSRAGFVAQCGANWSERQHNLLRNACPEHPLLLMASDSPHLTSGTLLQASESIHSHDAVIGRTRDGGYYLIGFRRYADVLRHIQMSTSSVADQVVASLRDRGFTVAELEPAFDVDTIDDLQLLIEVLKQEPERCSHTAAWLREFGFIPSSNRPAFRE